MADLSSAKPSLQEWERQLLQHSYDVIKKSRDLLERTAHLVRQDRVPNDCEASGAQPPSHEK